MNCLISYNPLPEQIYVINNLVIENSNMTSFFRLLYFDWKTVIYINLRLRKMLHTIYATQIILPPLSALFGLQFMLPMEKSVTFTIGGSKESIFLLFFFCKTVFIICQ
jgi:hypothetical protein